MSNSITKKEYFDWLKTSDKVGDECCMFSSCCGPHTFGRRIEKDGIEYELSWGWGWDEHDKTKHSYYVECLYKLNGQEGEGNMMTSSFNGTENIIQNYCITFTHNFNHKYSRIKNSFVIKGADITKEKALQIANILFPDYTDIEIESIENDEMTLIPSEYHFIQGILKERLSSRIAAEEQRKKENPESYYRNDPKYNEYLLMLIKKMEARMDQFPVYHT